MSENKNQVDPNTKSSVEEDPARSPAAHDPKELATINSKITTIEQNLSQLVDRVTKLETRIKLAEEINNRITMLETRMKAAEETAKITTNEPATLDPDALVKGTLQSK